MGKLPPKQIDPCPKHNHLPPHPPTDPHTRTFGAKSTSTQPNHAASHTRINKLIKFACGPNCIATDTLHDRDTNVGINEKARQHEREHANTCARTHSTKQSEGAPNLPTRTVYPIYTITCRNTPAGSSIHTQMHTLFRNEDTHTHTYLSRTHARTHNSTHAHMRTHTHTHKQTHIHTHTHARTHACAGMKKVGTPPKTA